MNRNSSNVSFLIGCLIFGMFPSIAIRSEGQSPYRSRTEKRVKIHLQSVCATRGKQSAVENEWILFDELVRGKMMVTSRGNTNVSPLSLIIMSMEQMGEVDTDAIKRSRRERKERLVKAGQFVDSDDDLDDGSRDTLVMSLEEWLLFKMKHTHAAQLTLVK